MTPTRESQVPTPPSDPQGSGLDQAVRRLCGAIAQMSTAADLSRILVALEEALADAGIRYHTYGLNLVDANAAPPQVRAHFRDRDGATRAILHGPEGARLLTDLWDRQELAYRPDRQRHNPYSEVDPCSPASVVDVPFSHGTLALSSLEVDAFPPGQIEILRTLASVLSLGLRRLHDLDDMLTRHRELEANLDRIRHLEVRARAINRVSEAVWAMSGSDDMPGVLRAVHTGLAELGVPYDLCGVNRVLDRPEDPTMHTITLSRQGDMSDHGALPAGPVYAAWRDEVVAYRRDLEAEDLHGEVTFIRASVDLAIRSVLDVPFSHGTLAVSSTRPGAFSDGHIADLQRLAEALGTGFRRLDDLEEIARRDEQLRQSQKMEAVGQLAGGVAHEFNNLLTVINGYARTLAERLPSGHPLADHARAICTAGARGASVIAQLLAFGRRQVLHPSTIDLGHALGDAARLLRPLLGETIFLEVDTCPEPCLVHLDTTQLDQVIVNLALNARDAMPGGGVLRLQARRLDLTGDMPLADPPLAPGAYVRLLVADAGRGMDALTRSRAFEPFFTTKPSGEGTGLGLPTVHGIVSQSDGHIALESQPGKGTSVSIYFPVAEAAPGLAGAADPPPGASGGQGETVLVVEDEELLRDLLARILEDAGYRPLCAPHADEAIALVDGGERPRVLVTDVVMPGMDGRELARRLLVQVDGLAVIYMSGYVRRESHAEAELAPGTPFLNKPFAPDSLLEHVAAALQAEA